MSTAIGSVTVSTEFDNKKLEKQYQTLVRKITKLEEDIAKKRDAQSPLVAQAEELRQKVKLAAAEVQQYGQAWRQGVIGADRDQTAAQERLVALREEYSGIVAQVEKYDAEISKVTGEIDRQKETAGGIRQELDAASVAATRELAAQKERAEQLAEQLAERLVAASSAGARMGEAINRAGAYMDKFILRIRRLAARALVFTVIMRAFRVLRDWMWESIKTNDEARKAIARLKGALLTLAQPLVAVVIPAFTAFVNLLASLLASLAKLVSFVFGSTAKASAEAAEALHAQKEAFDGVGAAAKKAGKSLAGFDEINQLSDTSTGGSAAEIAPDFSAVQGNWLAEVLGDAAGWVTTALLLGGIALIAIGAAVGSLSAILAGLTLLAAGVVVGAETGVLSDWAQTLGLNSVEQFVAIALTLGGIALVAIGAALANIVMILAGLGLLVAGLFTASTDEASLPSWAEKLGLESTTQFVSAAIALGGIALIALGAMLLNILIVLAGLALLAAGVIVSSTDAQAITPWAEKLGLDSVFGYVVAAMQLAGIALIAIGAATANIVMVIAGATLLALGVTAEAVGEETLKNWWEVLRLTSVQQWVGVTLLLGGIALIAIGAATANILWVIAGLGLIAVGGILSAQDRNLRDWVEVLGLQKVAGWVTAALLLGGIALIVFGAASANPLLLLAGLGLLGAGVSVGVTSGTFADWIDPIVRGFKGAVNLMLGFAEGFANGFIRAINTIINALNQINFDIPDWVPVIGGGKFGFNLRSVQELQIPRLATGAVIPPNREFLAVLGDQKSGTNIETPLATMIQAFETALANKGGGGTPDITLRLDGDLALLARVLRPYMETEGRRVGVKLVTGGI